MRSQTPCSGRSASDIGQHFPDTDQRWKGAPSHLFLTEAARLVRAERGRIGNVDLTILCEAPKIARTAIPCAGASPRSWASTSPRLGEGNHDGEARLHGAP
jgi:hypothetical protein